MKRWLFVFVAVVLVVGSGVYLSRPNFSVEHPAEQRELLKKIEERLETLYGVKKASVGYRRYRSGPEKLFSVVLHLNCGTLSTKAYYREIGMALSQLAPQYLAQDTIGLVILDSFRKFSDTERDLVKGFPGSYLKELTTEKEDQPLEYYCR